ncbi:hypothetical protein [Numidum massiliense]|uniref:hypothetical protein n=1 Tax=Numidum massiliense TaxID=1522315 RepID=UPI0006D553E0|nr:hypothetical protein [Numidum massiliense]
MYLHNVSLERVWPVVSADVLAYTELTQDPLYANIAPRAIVSYIDGALQIGQQAGKVFSYDGDLAPLMKQIAQSGTRVTFSDEKKREGNKFVRAQYEKKPPVIYIYRPSLEQMEHFFLKSGYRVRQEDFMALHMCHEWFHHLEETRFGRTDLQLPKVKMRKVGPVTFKQSVEKTREIAAHAFTQAVMGLSWYPLLLDYLMAQSEQKVRKEQIREKLYVLKQEYERLKEAQPTVV